jgi:hypothetical protein
MNKIDPLKVITFPERVYAVFAKNSGGELVAIYAKEEDARNLIQSPPKQLDWAKPLVMRGWNLQ